MLFTLTRFVYRLTFFLKLLPPTRSSRTYTLFPYTKLFRPKAETLATGHDRENHRDRMKDDAIADQPRLQHKAYQQLADPEHTQHQQHVQPIAILHQGRDQASDDTQKGTQIGQIGRAHV